MDLEHGKCWDTSKVCVQSIHWGSTSPFLYILKTPSYWIGWFLGFFQKDSWKTVLVLAYQSLGVVYGDLSISPLYVYRSTFAEDIQHSDTNEEIYGVLSFVFWTLTIVPLFKYVFVVLRADDNGEGKKQKHMLGIEKAPKPCWWIVFKSPLQVGLLLCTH